MKITPLLTSMLFALSLSGAAQAKIQAAPAPHTATATIEAEKCAPDATSPCLTSDAVAAGNGDSVDIATLPKADPAQQSDAAASPVPEPQTFAMMALGLALLGFSSRRRPPSDKFEN